MLQKVKEIFSSHPSQDKVFMTSDKYGFFNEVQANNHASSLKNKDVVKYTRADVENEVNTDENTEVENEVESIEVENTEVKEASKSVSKKK